MTVHFNPLTAKCIYIYAKIKIEISIEYDSSLLGEILKHFGAWEVILIHYTTLHHL